MTFYSVIKSSITVSFSVNLNSSKTVNETQIVCNQPLTFHGKGFISDLVWIETSGGQDLLVLPYMPCIHRRRKCNINDTFLHYVICKFTKLQSHSL